MNDRRKPLGGVDKDTFVHSAEDAQLNAELTYNLLAGMRSDLCFKFEEIKQEVADIKIQCSCRLEQCNKDFVHRMKIKDKSLPISRATFFFGCAMCLVLIGAGIWQPEKVLAVAKIILPFL